MNEQQLLDQPHARHSTKKLCYVCKYVDGTFRVVREPFRQLFFFVHAFVKSDGQLKQVPLAFILMTSRRRVDYVRVLQVLLDALPQPPAVQAVVSDFEAALWLAVRDVFPGVAQRGCAFHFSQAAWRNVQSVGVQSAYVKDDVINRPRLPQDTDAIVSCRQISLAMSSVNLNRWQLQEATLV